jgi:hypothetical protein
MPQGVKMSANFNNRKHLSVESPEVYSTIKREMRKGYTLEEAIEYVERVTYTKLPEDIIARIREDVCK